MRKYLQPSYFIDYQHPLVQKTVFQILKNNETLSQNEKAVKLFYFVRDKIKYKIVIKNKKFSVKTLYWYNIKASKVLEAQQGLCFPKAGLLVAMSRFINIPARLHFVDIINHLFPQELQKIIGGNHFFFHAYAELFLNNHWVKIAPTFDKDLSLKAGYPLVEFNGFDDALFPPFNSQGEKFIEYIKDRGVYASFPYLNFSSISLTKYYFFNKIKLRGSLQSKNV